MKEFIRALLRTQTAYRQAFQYKIKEKNIDLSYEMFQIMSHIFSEEKVNQQEIANKTFRDKSSLSCILKNLEKRNLIKRLEDKADKRNKLIILTSEGCKIQEDIQLILNEVYEERFKMVAPEVVSVCMGSLKEIEKVFKQNEKEG